MSFNDHVHGNSAATSPSFETVKIPDIFISFSAQPHTVNPFHEQAATESMLWLARLGADDLGDNGVYEYLHGVDVARWAASAVPEAGYEALRTFVDWMNIIFLFDDLFDSGVMHDDVHGTKDLLDSLLAPLRGQIWKAKKHPWVRAHDTVWSRVKATSSEQVSQRFRELTERYGRGVLSQVKANRDDKLSTIDERLERARRGSSGARMSFCLVEYAYSIAIPDEIYYSPEFQHLVDVASDIVTLTNDAISYVKEQTEGVNNNIVSICRTRGMPAQAAFDHVGERLRQCYKRWYQALADLPIISEEVDKHVQRYIQGMINCILAFAHGSFSSRRYLGTEGPKLDENTCIRIMVRISGCKGGLSNGCPVWWTGPAV